jgi:hypothetical protein
MYGSTAASPSVPVSALNQAFHPRFGVDNRARRRQHQAVEIIVVSTVWILFSCFLLFPLLGLAARMRWAAMTLLVAELVTTATWSYGSEGCLERPCAAAAEAGRTAATVDVPLLGVALVALAVIQVRRAVRRVTSPPPAPARARAAPAPPHTRRPRRASRRRAGPR